MRTEKGNNIINDNNIKKMIIKRINENINKTKINKLNPIKKGKNYTNKKLNLSLNNNRKFNLKNNESKKVINSNSYANDIHNNFNNIFLENKLYPFNIKKERNSIKYEKEKKHYPTRSKPIEFFEINFNDKTTLNTEYINSNYKEKDFIFNINNKSFNEESIRTLYLNSDESNNNKQSDNIKNTYINNNKNNNEKIYNSKPVERKIYFKNFLSKQKAKKRHSYENNSFISNRNNKQIDNFWNLSTLEFSNLEKTNTNRYNNNNNSLFLNDTKNKICLNNTYNKVHANTNLLNVQKNRNGISYNNKTLDSNKISIKNPSFVYIKNIVPNKVKHHSSKSQENIHGNRIKYSFLFNKKNTFNNRHKLYLSKMNDIVKIQKWWKDMIFRMYIEKKIIYIQRKYKKYLNNKRNKKNLFFYVNKIHEIILIQREWRQFKKRKVIKNVMFKKLDYSNDDSYEEDIPRLIPFKLDNFEINTLSESYLDTIKSKKENNEKNNSLQKKIYIKKNIKKKQLKKNNTVSNFFFSKYDIFPKSKSNNIIIQKNIINFTINSNKKTQTNNHGKNKYILVKNISIEINKVFHKNNISDIIHHIPINTKCFIEKRYESKIYKIDTIKNDCFISKTIKSKYMRDKILLLQKSVKKYLKHKYNFIKKPKLNINYITKVKKGINLLGNSNRNQSNQSDIFSFNGSNFIERINKDKINEKELYNLKRDKNLISNNVNLFSFDNRNNINLVINVNEKLRKLFKKYYIFLLISNIKNIRFMLIIKDIIINHIYKNIFDSLKLFILIENQAKIENITDNDEIDNKLNNTKSIKNRISLEYKNSDSIENNDDNLAYYIYNYFYNEKKFTNISIKLIKERLIKSPIINKTQNNIFNYMQTLYNDIISNKICNECFCKYGEKFDDNCFCHFNINNDKTQNKKGISLYRQKMNRIIHDINNKKRLLNNNKININIIKNNDENENNVNIEDNYNFKINYIKVKNEKDKNNNIINRYDTDSVNSRSRSVSK